MLESIKEQAERLGIEIHINEKDYEYEVTGTPWNISELYNALKELGMKVVASRNYLGTIFVRK